jgi:16S rRNA (cytosine1402-N4)-methyltransferase
VLSLLPSVWRGSLAIHDQPHIPVLGREVVAWLDLEPGMTVVDGTFGAGGHATLLAEAMEGRGTYVAVDRDPTAREHFDRFAAGFPDVSSRWVRGNYALAFRNLAATGLQADAVLLDLGVSSMQIDRPERGFSYAVDAPLDMRMDPSEDRTAADLLNTLPERELSLLFHRLGDEQYARPIARAIARRRGEAPYARTGELVDTIRRAIPAPALFGQGHPAKRVFQALRIAVNGELDALAEGLGHALDVLRPGGRIAVISFHSLEDRIVKTTFRQGAQGCICPPDLPVCMCGRDPLLRVLTPRVVRPGEAEVEDNPRAASSRLRVAERTDVPRPEEDR